jgi:hypothetical protein
MSRRTVLLVCGPLAALGLATAGWGTVRVQRARRGLATLATTSAFEGRAFAETLQGAHVEAQLQALTQRRAIARELAAARRDRLLGVILLAGTVLAWAGLRSLTRMADELDDDRRHLGLTGTGGREKVDWKGP